MIGLAFCEGFSVKYSFPTNPQKFFSLENFPLYGIICELCNILSCVVYDLSPFPFQSFSPIPITPFQVPPVFGSNAGPDSLNLRQVYQPVPGDQATDTTDLVLG